jgi:SNF2 family DNA or RNA helicase
MQKLAVVENVGDVTDAVVPPAAIAEEVNTTESETIPMADFIASFGAGLLDAVRAQNPAVYRGTPDAARTSVLQNLKRPCFPEQAHVVQAVSRLLIDRQEPAAVINAEMGTGKTQMAIATAAVMHAEGYQRTLVLSPPHLVYKWRREIQSTVPGAKVWVLNGPDTLRKLLLMRELLKLNPAKPSHPEFFILGRVRMRMGFNWAPAFNARTVWYMDGYAKAASCPRCGAVVLSSNPSHDQDWAFMPLFANGAETVLEVLRTKCEAVVPGQRHRRGEPQKCGEPLWSLVRSRGAAPSRTELLKRALEEIPTIGAKTALMLMKKFGEDLLADMLQDNIFEFVNLMDENGELVFSDRKARRIERGLANMEISFGAGGYQPTEFIKRYLPQDYFGLLVIDEGHEYKSEGSAQGQAFAVLTSKCRKSLLLTGTLMGGYADDLFYLLWRLDPRLMIDDGFRYSSRSSLSQAAMRFLREHGCVTDIYKQMQSRTSHRTSAGSKVTHHAKKAPGFGPYGIMRYVLPITVFLKLRDLKGNVLPAYREEYLDVAMTESQSVAYKRLEDELKSALKAALRAGDHSLLGVVMNALLAYPDCAFREEVVVHPHRRQSRIGYAPAVFAPSELSPKEQALVELCKNEKALGRKVLVYTVYSGVRDTQPRLKNQLVQAGFRVAVLTSTVEAVRREDWVMEAVDRGVDVLICNPELVKTGLDLLDFPTIVYMQSGYNVYTLQQASRRSWRIGQKNEVKVIFLGYAESAQVACLKLMAKKIAVSQSASGDMPDSGLDVLNQGGDSIEVALAKQLVA